MATTRTARQPLVQAHQGVNEADEKAHKAWGGAGISSGTGNEFIAKIGLKKKKVRQIFKRISLEKPKFQTKVESIDEILRNTFIHNWKVT